MNTTRIRTVPVRVKVYTDRFVVSGLVHTKPGGYKERVSDLVNDQTSRFVVLTEVTFRPADDEAAPAKRCPTMIVRIEDIHFIIPFEEQVAPGAGGPEPVSGSHVEH
jgi:hypothetical protein